MNNKRTNQHMHTNGTRSPQPKIHCERLHVKLLFNYNALLCNGFKWWIYVFHLLILIWFEPKSERDTVNIKRQFERSPSRFLALSCCVRLHDEIYAYGMVTMSGLHSAQWDAIKLVSKWEAHYNAIIMCTRCVFKFIHIELNPKSFQWTYVRYFTIRCVCFMHLMST